MPPAITIAVLGGGCSGVLTAAHLLRDPSSQPREVVLVERATVLGRGTAFGTASPSHLLNVPACRMSAYTEQCDHFLDWARRRDPSVGARSFLPRQWYGEYLGDVLDEAVREAAPVAHFRSITGEIASVSRCPEGGLAVRMADGSVLRADDVVLAVGNLPPADPWVRDPSFFADERYTRDPWQPDALDAIGIDDAVLLLGSGLTAVDVVLRLDASGHRGPIHAVSRRGLLPLDHLPAGACSAPCPDLGRLRDIKTATALMRAVRIEVAAAQRRGEDWRSVVDGMRPHTAAVWRGLPEPERRRFLRHAVRCWEVHRHRMAPEVSQQITQLRETGRFRVVAGRADCLRRRGDVVDVGLRHRTGARSAMSVHRVVNCTGPGSDVARAEHPVLSSLLRAGAVRPGPCALGLATDEHGALLDATGEVSGDLWTLGSLRRGDEWETTAVEDIRRQAAALAGGVLADARCPGQERLRAVG